MATGTAKGLALQIYVWKQEKVEIDSGSVFYWRV